jgi:hypothetical protein
MKRLTDSQLIVLSRATQRDDGIATPPANMRGCGPAKVGQALVDWKLMRLIRTSRWRSSGTMYCAKPGRVWLQPLLHERRRGGFGPPAQQRDPR